MNFAHGALFMIGAFCAVTMQRHSRAQISTVTIDEDEEPIFWVDPLESRRPPSSRIGSGRSSGQAILDYSVPLAITARHSGDASRSASLWSGGLIKHFYKRPHADQILVTFGLAIVLQEIIKAYFGANPIQTPAPDQFRHGPSTLAFSSALMPASIIYPYWRSDLLHIRAGRDHHGGVRLPAIHDIRDGRPSRNGGP